MTILDGKNLSSLEKERIKQEVALLDFSITLAVILVGNNPASASYVASKEKSSKYVGFQSMVIKLPEHVEEKELLKKIDELNGNPDVNGILVQLPLPPHIDENKVIETINPMKDVDCFHPYNFGRLFAGNPIIEPCTPKGIMKFFHHYNIELKGKNAVVIGRSNIVGKPIAAMMMKENATVTICHSKTRNLSGIVSAADIVVAAIGKPMFVNSKMIKEGAVVIDVGINRIEDNSRPKGYRIVGDVDFDDVANKVAAITPVPGGVGVMTVTMLLDNTLKLAKLQHGIAE